MPMKKTRIKDNLSNHLYPMLLIATIFVFTFNDFISTALNRILPFEVLNLSELVQKHEELIPDEALEQLIITFIFPAIVIFALQAILFLFASHITKQNKY